MGDRSTITFDYDLELIGVNLDHSEKDFVNNELVLLDQNFPIDGKMQLQIRKQKGSQTLHGNLRVLCSNKIIESTQDGANIYQLCKKLAKEINGQIYKII